MLPKPFTCNVWFNPHEIPGREALEFLLRKLGQGEVKEVVQSRPTRNPGERTGTQEDKAQLSLLPVNFLNFINEAPALRM